MPTTVVTPGLSEPVVRLGAPPIPAPARVTADRVGAVLQPVVAYRESLGRRAYVIAHPAVRESPRQWPIAMDVIGRALPGLELLSYEGADLRQDEGSREGYEQRWPQLLATLGAVVSVPSTLGGTSALGRFAFIELESAVADGLPAFIYDRAIQTLHAASDCRLRRINLRRHTFRDERRWSNARARFHLSIQFPEDSGACPPAKAAAFQALGLAAPHAGDQLPA